MSTFFFSFFFEIAETSFDASSEDSPLSFFIMGSWYTLLSASIYL
jgi:hypothetical protein